jgi:hypothetical protein
MVSGLLQVIWHGIRFVTGYLAWYQVCYMLAGMVACLLQVSRYGNAVDKNRLVCYMVCITLLLSCAWPATCLLHAIRAYLAGYTGIVTGCLRFMHVLESTSAYRS